MARLAPPDVFAPGEQTEDEQEAEQQSEPFDIDGMAMLLAGSVLIVGNIICARAKVDMVSDEEAGALGGNVANMLRLYDFKGNPKVVGWCLLGSTVAAITLPRLGQYQARKTEEAAEQKSEPSNVNAPGQPQPQGPPAASKIPKTARA